MSKEPFGPLPPGDKSAAPSLADLLAAHARDSAPAALPAADLDRAPTGDLTGQPLRQRSMGRLFVRGLVMNLTNPKVVFFFLALLPQFVQPGRGSVSLQLMALGGIFIAATLLSFGSITVFAAAVSARLKRSPQAQRVLNWVAGTVFLGMAARLAISER